MSVVLQGVVSSRSSRGSGGPPGETEVMRLNPQREQKLLEITGWSRLAPGTLNVECSETGLADVFARLKPLWHEPWESVTYPRKYRRIPQKRGGYLYYGAALVFAGQEAPIVVRRAVNPLKKRIEVYAETNLKEALGIADDDVVSISFE